jgi:4-carboxymuconolactone decarboxylase
MPAVEVHFAPAQPVATGSADTFTGIVRFSSPFQALPPGKAGGATVTFEASARTAWHSHPLGQTLIVTAGLGLVQQQGQPAYAIRPGDVVAISPNVRHWHGAGPNGSMTHVAIAEREDCISVIWQNKVTDQDYQAALACTGLGIHPSEKSLAAVRAQPKSETLSAK